MKQVGEFSKRSAILKRVLFYLDQDEWRDFGDYMVFGLTLLTDCGPPNLEHGLPSDLTIKYKRLLEFHAAFDTYLNQKIARERTAIKVRADDSKFLKVLRSLPEDRLRKYALAFLDLEAPPDATFTPEDFLQELKDLIAMKDLRGAWTGSSALSEGETDGLDAHYCNEVIDKLDLIVFRTSRLEAIRIEKIPNTKVSHPFEEAMRCYLYGFDMACAATCRALLEAALKETIDPEMKLRPSKEEKGRQASYYLKLVDKALADRKLSEPLAQPGGPADQVKGAGDAAVHDADKFARECPTEKVEWLLDMTRKMLLELYGEDT